jgi:hypothetical protein
MLRAIPLFLLLACSIPASADYWPPTNPASAGIRDLMLFYVGSKDHYVQADLLPYVAFLDKAGGGKPVDWFYDAYQFMMFGGAPSGTTYIDGATDFKDWRYYVDTLFAPKMNLAALDAAIAEAAKTLGSPAKKTPVILMMPYISPKQKAFGDIDGSGQVLDFSRASDAAKAATWLVDETARRFQAAGYKHLSLWGYYWMNEGIPPGDVANVKATAQVVHDRNFGFHWIPWFNAPGVTNWRDFGFDFVIMQPNYAFMDAPRNEQRLSEAAALCRKYNMGIEMELAFQVLSNGTDRGNLSDYLNHGLANSDGYMSTVRGYYQGELNVAELYHSDLPVNNALYRDLYEFHKGTYKGRDFSLARGLGCEVQALGRATRRVTDLAAGVSFPVARTVVSVDLGTVRRVGEARLHLRLPAAEKDTVCFARGTLSDTPGGPGQLVGEAIASPPLPETGATWLSLKGRGAMGRYLRVEFSGSVQGDITLDGLRVLPTAGQGVDLRYTTNGRAAPGVLADGAFATPSGASDAPSGDSGMRATYPDGKGKIGLQLPADRYLSRLWLHATKRATGQWPQAATVEVGGRRIEQQFTPPPAGEWAAYLGVPLPRVRGESMTVGLTGTGTVELDEIEIEPATNLARGKPYTVEPSSPSKYPDDGKKLTDGELSAGFSDGKTVGWISSQPSIILDLGQTRPVDQVRMHVEGGGAAGVYWPQAVTVWTSADGDAWLPAPKRIVPDPEGQGADQTTMAWLATATGGVQVRYVKIDFVPRVWLMVDEIEVTSGGQNAALGCAYRLLTRPAGESRYADDGRKLTDGEVSEHGWDASRVIGFEAVDPTYTVDLLKPQRIGLVAAHTCGGGNAAVWYPEEMSVETSLDGVTWTAPVVTREHPKESGTEATVAVMEAKVGGGAQGEARFVRLHFTRHGWCMVDEVEVYAEGEG